MAKQDKSAAELYREERKQRLAKAAKKNAKRSHAAKIEKIIAAAIVIVLVVGIAGFAVGAVINSTGVLERGKTIMTVGEKEVDKYEYAYYYNMMYTQYFNMGAQYGGMYTGGFEYTKLPSEQEYPGKIEGVKNPTWADFFSDGAKNNIKYTAACVAYAEKNDIKLDEKEIASVEKNLSDYEESAESYGFSLSAYLRKTVGKGMTPDILKKILMDQKLVEKVNKVKSDEYIKGYTDEKIEKQYLDEIRNYGVVTLRNYVIKAETKSSAEGQAPVQPDEAAIAAAKAKAEEFESKLNDEESFKNLVGEFEKEAGNKDYQQLVKDDSKTLLKDAGLNSFYTTDEEFLEWVADDETEIGDTYVLKGEDGNFTVYMMVEPVHKAADTMTYDIRHILLKFPEEEKEETADEAEDKKDEKKDDKKDEKKDEKVEVTPIDESKYDVNIDIRVDTKKTKDTALYKQAQDILVKYLEGEKTEEAFAALAAENSADSNAADGGIYEEVPLGQMVPEFETWATDPARKNGDVGIVETTYGYHIMYFIKTNTKTWEDAIKHDLAHAEFDKFAEKLTADKNVAIKDIDAELLNDVTVATEKYFKDQLRAMQQQGQMGY